MRASCGSCRTGLPDSISGRDSAALKKVERFSVQKVTGDVRCLFRALEFICDCNEERRQYVEALIAITVDEPLKWYCQRIERPDFWGGEPELLVISKLCRQPIVVHIPEHAHASSGWGSGFILIAEYGLEFCKGSRNKKKNAVRLLYIGRNHYDLPV